MTLATIPETIVIWAIAVTMVIIAALFLVGFVAVWMGFTDYYREERELQRRKKGRMG